MKLTSSGKRHAATVYLLGNIAQKVERFIEANSVSQIANLDSQSNTSHLVFGANNFVWTKPPKDFICIMLHQLLISTDVESYTKGTDSESRILKNILVQDGNPEQQIPRLIELVKMFGSYLNGLPPKEHLIATKRSKKNPGTKIFNVDLHSSVYISKKMASEIDFSMVVLPTDIQVEQELTKDSDSSQNNGFTSEE
ncbi:hypothetical protein PPACK8108_LOCUS858 [Phakopsora pachyrhizi]|uniref:Uncharacterized protein n=1 Tax=Phakopsora pachyrhizi TaxID=170000 RepID=A0AAV0AH70_PHAPC|nr:hypothetical protein PPACK8108_LOCUS858 [Phakopsora pachyrhizi]